MKRFYQPLIFLIFLVLLFLSHPLVYGADLGKEAMGVLKEYCYSCHGVKHEGDPNWSVTDLNYMIHSKDRLIVPGSASQSLIYQRAGHDMPPKGNPFPTNNDLDILRAWIESGARPPAVVAKARQLAKARKLIPQSYILSVISQDRGISSTNVYFSLVNLYNAGVGKEDLNYARAALAKVVNCVHLRSDLVYPEPIDPLKLIFRVDRRDTGWTNRKWQLVLDNYPYYEAHDYVRADWFISKAMMPPLYYSFLSMPKTDKEFDDALHVNTEKDLLTGNMLRAGVMSPRDSNNNRVVDRHQTRFGAYWNVFGFTSQEGNQDVMTHPLGPDFEENTNGNLRFHEDTEEVLFTLPCGTPGFVTTSDEKIQDSVDERVASDPTRISGSGRIFAGLSCVTCHTKVIQDEVQDSVRNGAPFQGNTLSRIDQIYVPQRIMNEALKFDQNNFLAVMQSLQSPYMQDNDKTEPIRGVVERHNTPLDLNSAANEIAVPPLALKKAIQSSPELQSMGLRPLFEGQTISRKAWTTKQRGMMFTPAQVAAGSLTLFRE